MSLRRCYTFPMRRSLRLIFLVLLMTAVPVRGAIGASMVLCDPAYGGSATALQFTAALGHHGNLWSVATVHDHQQHALVGEVRDHGAAGSAHDLGGLGNAEDPAKATCSMCAACCAGGSILLSAALNVPVVEHVDALFPPVLVRFERRPPDGLERPPHTHLV